MNVDQLKELITGYNLDNCALGNQGFNRILLQLFGYLGHGKSSLINSCKHVLQDRKKEFTVIAESGAEDGGLTMERKSYQLTPTITIVDNRGCSTLNGYETGEIYAQLGNLVPLDERVEWTKEFEQIITSMEDPEVVPNYSDIIVPIFVYSVKKDLTEQEFQEIKLFLTNCRNLTGIFPIVVLTHKTSGDSSRFRNIFEGMGAEEIFAVENYTMEDHFETRGRHLQFLNLMYKVLEDVNFKMQKKISPKKERAKHKAFLYSFLHRRKVVNSKDLVRPNISSFPQLAETDRTLESPAPTHSVFRNTHAVHRGWNTTMVESSISGRIYSSIGENEMQPWGELDPTLESPAPSHSVFRNPNAAQRGWNTTMVEPISKSSRMYSSIGGNQMLDTCDPFCIKKESVRNLRWM